MRNLSSLVEKFKSIGWLGALLISSPAIFYVYSQVGVGDQTFPISVSIVVGMTVFAIMGQVSSKFSPYHIVIAVTSGAFPILIHIRDSVAEIVVSLGLPLANPNALYFYLAASLSVVLVVRLCVRWYRHKSSTFFALFSAIMLAASTTAGTLFHYTQFTLSMKMWDKEMNNAVVSVVEKDLDVETFCKSQGFDCVTGFYGDENLNQFVDTYPEFNGIYEHSAERPFMAHAWTDGLAQTFHMFALVKQVNGRVTLIRDFDRYNARIDHAANMFTVLYSAFSAIWILFGIYLIRKHQKGVVRGRNH